MFQNINSLCSKWYFLIASSLPYFVLLFNVLGGEEIMAERGSGTELVDVRNNFTFNFIYRNQKLNSKSVLGLGTIKTIFFRILLGQTGSYFCSLIFRATKQVSVGHVSSIKLARFVRKCCFVATMSIFQ